MIDDVIRVPEGRGFVFVGRIHPERACLTIDPLGAAISAEDGSWRAVLRYSISFAQVSAIMHVDGQAPDLLTLRNHVFEFVQEIVDAYGYLEGRTYDLELTSVLTPEGEHVVFGVEIPELQAERGLRPANLDGLLRSSLEHQPHLRRALADLRQAIKSPVDTGFHCYRAVETLHHAVASREGLTGSAKARWEVVRGILNVEEALVRKIQLAADEVRHGKPIVISGAERLWLFRATWRFVDRFVKYTQGTVPLEVLRVEDIHPEVADAGPQ